MKAKNSKINAVWQVEAYWRKHIAAYKDTEALYAILLTAENRVIGHRLVADGTPKSFDMVAFKALKEVDLGGAKALILVHYRPDWAICTADDARVANQIKFDVACNLGISVQDYVIVSSQAQDFSSVRYEFEMAPVFIQDEANSRPRML